MSTEIETSSAEAHATAAGLPAVPGVDGPLGPSADERQEALRTRLILPLLLPIASVAALFFYALNLSRALLAGGKWGSLIIASIIAAAILATAMWITAHPKMRSSTLVMLTAALFVLVSSMGLTSLGPSQEKKEAATSGFQEPKGPAASTIDVTAEATLKFDSTSYTATAGIVQINYLLGGG